VTRSPTHQEGRCGAGRDWRRRCGLSPLAALLAALLTGCSDEPIASLDAGLRDAGLRDATVDAPLVGPLVATIVGAPYVYVGASSCFALDHNGGPAAVSRVRWGDGSTETFDGATSSACHTYTTPGPLVVGLAVDARGYQVDASQLVHVVHAPSSPRPTASSTLAYDAAQETLWVVEADADRVAVIDVPTRTRRTLVIVGDRPRTLALVGSQVVIACQGDDTLHVLDTRDDSHTIVALPPGSAPFGVVADPRGGRVWVSLQGRGELVALRLDGALAMLESPLSVGRDPRALAMRSDGMIVVTRWRATQMDARVYVVDASDARAPRLDPEVALPRETGRDSDTDNDGVLSFLDSAAPAPDGSRVIVAGLKANVVAGLARTGRRLTSQTTARAALVEVGLGARGEAGYGSLRRSLDDLDYVSALVFSPMGETLYALIEGAEAIIALDAFTFDSAGSIDDIGHGADGLALDATGTLLFVHAALSREVRIYDVRDLSTEPIALGRIPTVDVEPLAPDVLAGAIVFHRSRDARMSRTRYLSCASCHRDGEADGLIWDFTQRGEGLRNTVPLRGRAGTAHGPLHWSANFDEIQDFEHDIRNGQGGTGFLDDSVLHIGTRDTTLGEPKAGLSAELDALAAYVASLDVFGTSASRRDDDPLWRAARARGEVIFRNPAVGCASCHSGTRYTDSAFLSAGVPLLHDVGTLSASSGSRLGAALVGLDTPTLRGLWASAPYLHDGSAATLREVLRARNDSDLHGVTSALDDAQLADLETFLLALDDAAP